MAELTYTCIRMAVSRKGRTERTRNRNVCNNKRIAKLQISDYVQLFRWFKREYGGRAKHLSPAVFPDTGRGLMTRRFLRPGDVVISIPIEALITTETVLGSTVGSHIKRWAHRFTAEQVLCMFLMYEQHLGPLSSYAPYINTIPEDFTTPAYFNDADLHTLPPSFQYQSKESVKKIKDSFSETEEFCGKWWPDMLGVFNWTAFVWSWFAVNTRCVYLEKAANPHLRGGGNMALAPVLDLLNHSPWAKVKAGLNSTGTAYEIVTFDSYQPHDQVFICYGDHSNSTLLLEYGFTIPHNPNNCYHFSQVELQTMAEVFNISDLERKDQIVREAGLQNVTVNGDGLSWKLQTYLRILAMTWDEMQGWAVVLGGERVSDHNERRMNAMAHWLLSSALQQNDKQLQKFRDDLTVHGRMSLSLYQDDQHILHTCLKQLKTDS